MAQTRTITRRKLAALGILDFASRALHGVYVPPPPRSGPPRAFLVIEPWGIGDVVLSTAAMSAIRASFQGSSITLLAKSYAEPLLRETGLVDELIPFDFPWTAFTGKFQPQRYVPQEFRDLISTLRERDFDVSLDARRDIRSNTIAFLAGARRRIGYDFGGGAHLLTDVIPSGEQNEHKVSDWLALLRPLGVETRAFRPTLKVSERERSDARETLTAMGVVSERRIIGVHPGASQKVRRWDDAKFADVIDQISGEADVDIVVFEDARGSSNGIKPKRNVARVSADLRAFMALLTQCDLLLCSDSGPMHIAGALGVPVTALFGPQRKEWYGPRGETDAVVHVDDMPCRPCFDACIFARPVCMDQITTQDVVATIREQLVRVARADRSGQI